MNWSIRKPTVKWVFVSYGAPEEKVIGYINFKIDDLLPNLIAALVEKKEPFFGSF